MKNKKILLSSALFALLLTGCNDTDVPSYVITNVTDNGQVQGVIRDESSAGINIEGIEQIANDPDSKSDQVRTQPFTLSGLDLNKKFFNVYAQDAADNKSQVTTLVNKSNTFDEAISLRLNNSALSFAGEELNSVLDSLDLIPLLEGDTVPLEPFYIQDVLVSEIHWWITHNEENFGIEGSNIRINSLPSSNENARLEVKADFSKIKLEIESYGLNEQILLTGANITSNGTVSISVDPTDNSLRVELDTFSFDIGTLIPTRNGEPYPTIGSLIKGTIETEAKDILKDKILVLLTDLLKDIPSTLDDDTLALSALPQILSSDIDGANIILNGHTESKTVGSDLPNALGSLYVATPLTVDSSNNTHLTTTISSNLLNQALLAAFESGITNYSSEEPVSGYDYEITSLTPAYINLGTDLGDIGVFNLDYFRVDLTKVGDSDISETAYMSLSVNLNDNTIGLNDGTLKINLEHQNITVNILDLENKSNSVKALLNSVSSILKPLLVPNLTQSLNNIPVPSLYGYNIDLVDKYASNANKAHLTLTGDITPIALTTLAMAPTTYGYVQEAPQGAYSPTAEVNTDTTITLNFSGDNPTDHPLKYRYKIDNGNWSVWTSDEALTLYNIPSGTHTATICSRTYQMKVDPNCTEVSFYK